MIAATVPAEFEIPVKVLLLLNKSITIMRKTEGKRKKITFHTTKFAQLLTMQGSCILRSNILIIMQNVERREGKIPLRFISSCTMSQNVVHVCINISECPFLRGKSEHEMNWISFTSYYSLVKFNF